MTNVITVAVVGCLHGELDKVYSLIGKIETKRGIKVDLVLCCGDFQSARDQDDLESMAVPRKYRRMMDFHKYYSGSLVAPILTVFIGGNHEASRYLWELPYGGWVAPNIFYMGYSNVVSFAGYKIAGISGIFKGHDYGLGHFETPPLNESTLRSIYHTRRYEVSKILQVDSDSVDVFMSHDWPCEIWNYGDLNGLLRRKPFFEEDISTKKLGSRHLMEVVRRLRPKMYFCAHLHVHFTAEMYHVSDCHRSDSADSPATSTKFMALDKVSNRKFLEITTLGEAKGPRVLSYDQQWLAITKLYSAFHAQPIAFDTVLPPSPEFVKEVGELFGGQFVVPASPIPGSISFSSSSLKENTGEPTLGTNPQTEEFCRRLGIPNPCSGPVFIETKNPDEIPI